jgi:hypothetical protein
MIPGALPVDLDDLESALAQFHPGDIVVYCACPNDATAVKVAMLLSRRGIRRVRPLAGGFDAWVRARPGDHQLFSKGRHRMDKIKPLFTATATATGGRNGRTESSEAELAALVNEAHEKICPYSHATRNNVDVQLTVVGR